MTVLQIASHVFRSAKPALSYRALSSPAQVSNAARLRQRLHTPGLSATRSATAAPGHCSAALLSRETKEKLVSGVNRDHVELVMKILDQASSAAQQWSVAHTDFLTPPARADAMIALNRLSDVACITSGGFPQAERCRLSVGHAETVQVAVPEWEGGGYPGAVAALKVSGQFGYESVTHGDFLGAVLGCGITREKVGDILVQGEGGAHILVADEVAEYLTSGAFYQVRNVSVVVDRVPLSQVEVKPPKVDVLRATEASLRVDAVASAGFKTSRTKLAELISGGAVRVNWKDISKAGAVLRTGDVISVRGKGRLEIGEISMTKKGRYSIEITRYI